MKCDCIEKVKQAALDTADANKGVWPAIDITFRQFAARLTPPAEAARVCTRCLCANDEPPGRFCSACQKAIAVEMGLRPAASPPGQPAAEAGFDAEKWAEDLFKHNKPNERYVNLSRYHGMNGYSITANSADDATSAKNHWKRYIATYGEACYAAGRAARESLCHTEQHADRIRDGTAHNEKLIMEVNELRTQLAARERARRWPEGRPYESCMVLVWLPKMHAWERIDTFAMKDGEWWLPQPPAPKEVR